MKNQISIVTGNLLGAAAGALVVYYVAKKHVSHKWALVAVVLVGSIAGAHAQSMIKAKQGAAKSAAVVK